MKKVIIKNHLPTSFAENKDIAANLRIQKILPALDNGESLTIDFEDIHVATQSFVHALIADVLRQHKETALELITFKNCSDAVRVIIENVVQYVFDAEYSNDASIDGKPKKSKV